jgi:predicted RNase H-like nuclease (RuvC/YqgF family)
MSDSKEKAVQEMNRIIGSYSAEQEKNIQLEYKFKRAEQEFRDLQSELKIAKDTIASLEQQFCLPEKITKLLS